MAKKMMQECHWPSQTLEEKIFLHHPVAMIAMQ
jgi:hypothetical protein